MSDSQKKVSQYKSLLFPMTYKYLLDAQLPEKYLVRSEANKIVPKQWVKKKKVPSDQAEN